MPEYSIEELEEIVRLHAENDDAGGDPILSLFFAEYEALKAKIEDLENGKMKA